MILFANGNIFIFYIYKLTNFANKNLRHGNKDE